jgi:hypothetical protein
MIIQKEIYLQALQGVFETTDLQISCDGSVLTLFNRRWSHRGGDASSIRCMIRNFRIRHMYVSKSSTRHDQARLQAKKVKH